MLKPQIPAAVICSLDTKVYKHKCCYTNASSEDAVKQLLTPAPPCGDVTDSYAVFLVKSFLSADPNTFTRYTSDPSAGYTGVQIGVVWFGLSAALSDKDTQYGSKFVVMKILFMFLQKVSYAHQGCIY